MVLYGRRGRQILHHHCSFQTATGGDTELDTIKTYRKKNLWNSLNF